MRPIGFGLILALSLERHIAGWDVVMLTESLSISLLVLFLGSLALVAEGLVMGEGGCTEPCCILVGLHPRYQRLDFADDRRFDSF